MITLQKINLKFNLKYIYNICIFKCKRIYLYSLYYYVVLFEFDLPYTSRVIEFSGRLLWGTYSVFLTVLCYNNMDITMFIQDLLYKYITDMSDLFNLNMSSPSSNGNPLPPMGGGDGGMNGMPSPGGSGDDLSLVVAGGSRNSNDDDNLPLVQPRSDIVPFVKGPYRRVEWNYIEGERIDGGFLAGRDRIFIDDYDQYRIPVDFFENRYNIVGQMFDSKKIHHDRGLLLGTNGGYGIGRIIWNNQYYYGFIIPEYPTFASMTKPGITLGTDPFTSIRANFRFPNYIFSPERSTISTSGRSIYVELGIQYNFFYINPRNFYICELTYPDGYQEKITNLKELSDFILKHRAEMLGCSTNVSDQVYIMSRPDFNTFYLPGLNTWIRDRLDTAVDIPEYMNLYRDLVEEFPRLRRFLPSLPPSPSLSEVDSIPSESENDNNINGIT